MLEAVNWNSKIETFLKASIGDNYKAEELLGDASHRKYYRIERDSKSYILMIREPYDLKSDPFISILRCLESCSIPCPYLMSYDGHLGLMLLEDLGNLSLQKKFLEEGELATEPFYKKALDTLVQMQFTMDTNLKSCLASQRRFYEENLFQEMIFAEEHLFKTLLKIPYEKEKMSAFFRKICKSLSLRKKVFCHRDYHSRNIMVYKEGAYLIDFQDALMGPLAYDLVSLLYDGYVPLKADFREKMIHHYTTEAGKHFAAIKAELAESLNDQILQRTFKACGSFASFSNIKGVKSYLKYLPQNLDVLEKTLKEAYPEEKEFLDAIQKTSHKVASL